MKIQLIQDFIDKVRGKDKNLTNITNLKFDLKKEYIRSSEKSNRLLIVFPRNFFVNKAGNSAYCYRMVKNLKNFGYDIDFLSTTLFSDNGEFDNFNEINNKNGNIINKLYLSKLHKKRNKNYAKNSWVTDDMLNIFDNLISTNNYDYIFIHYMNFFDLVRLSKYKVDSKIIGCIHDFDSLQIFYSCGNKGIEKFNRFGSDIQQEIQSLNICDILTYISYDEKIFFERFFPEKKFVFLPFCNEAKQLPIKKDIDCLFIGYSNIHNLNSIVWFVENVLDNLDNNINITICGKICEQIKNKEINIYNKLKQFGANFINYAEDLDDLYSRTKIAIVPMLTGTGMKIKTITAMSYGIPVVSTLLGIDGFPDKTQNGCLVTNSPKKFAKYIDRLLKDSVFYNETKSNVINYYNLFFSSEKEQKIFEEILQ